MGIPRVGGRKRFWDLGSVVLLRMKLSELEEEEAPRASRILEEGCVPIEVPKNDPLRL